MANLFLVLSAVVLGFSTAAFGADGDVRLVFKAPSPWVRSSGLKKMSFGLSSQQIDEILRLTNGEVNFGNVFYVDQNPSMTSILMQGPGYRGAIHPHVPPPVMIENGDPELAGQWWIDTLNVPTAWQKATGRGVTIADCDAGYFYNEPDLFPNMVVDQRYDVSDLQNPLVVDDGPWAHHGTAVSAIMASVRDGQGTNGIAFDARIVPLQNYNYDSNKDGLDKEEATAKCILHAISVPDVKIIVLENQTQNGSSETFVGTRDAVRLALRSGIIVVGAGGNASVELTEEKQDDTGSIIVGALSPDQSAASFSNYGDRITVGAFGRNLHTLYGPNGAYGEFGGTSGATPQVAATVALMKEVSPSLTPEAAREILIRTRIVKPENQSVGGLIDVVRAVDEASATHQWPAWQQKLEFRSRLAAILTR